MAIRSDKFIKFSDATALQSEGFVQKPNHGYNLSSNELMTKTEVAAVWALDTSGSQWTSLASNQWVARWRMQQPGDVGSNIMGTPSCGSSTHNSIIINWSDPQDVKTGQTINYWEVQYYHWADGGGIWNPVPPTQFGNASTRTHTLQNLLPDSLYMWRVRFHTTGGEYSNWAEWSCNTIGYDPPNTYLLVSNVTNRAYVYLMGAGENDYYTIELTINAAGTVGSEADWYVLDSLSITGPVDYFIKGWEDTVHPTVMSTVVWSGDGSLFAVFDARAIRPMVCWFQGSVRITNSANGFSYNSAPVTFNLYGENYTP